LIRWPNWLEKANFLWENEKMAEFYKEKEEKIIDKKMLFIIADDLIGSTSGLLKRIKTEDELKIEFEKLLEPVCKELSINFETRYGRTIIKGRSDAVHGRGNY